MSATITHLNRRHGTMRDVLSAAPPAPVIPFRAGKDSLTDHPVRALESFVSNLGIGWICETERDALGDLWTIIGPGDPEVSGYTAFLICRKEGALTLIEAPASAPWRMLGIYDDANALAVTLGETIKRRCWH